MAIPDASPPCSVAAWRRVGRVLAFNCSGRVAAMTCLRLLQQVGPRLLALRDRVPSRCATACPSAAQDVPERKTAGLDVAGRP